MKTISVYIKRVLDTLIQKTWIDTIKEISAFSVALTHTFIHWFHWFVFAG